jgi:hypothetical protein
MSILNDLLKGKITFATAAAEAEQWAANIVAHDANLAPAAASVLADVKQGASNAVELAGTELGGLISNVTSPLESALDAMLAKASGGVSLPFNALVNHSIDTIAAAVQAEVTAWTAKTKASLAGAPTQNH